MPAPCLRRLRALCPACPASRVKTVSRAGETKRLRSGGGMRQPDVHVLGLGGIGTFAAYSLGEIPITVRPRITLLLHRPSLLEQYIANGSGISLTTADGQLATSRCKFDVEFMDDDAWCRYSMVAGPGPTTFQRISTHTLPIENLVVSVKAGKIVDALRPLKQRLNSRSTILLLQNGVGMIDELNQQLFKDEATRPRYMIGVISHGITLNHPFNITQTGVGKTSLGLVPQPGDDKEGGARDSYLLTALPLAKRLNATSHSYLDVLQIQLEKLAANAFCNPLCALNDAENAFVLDMRETRHALLSEISRVVQALPELQGRQDVLDRFSVARLEMAVNDIVERTAKATCSMVVDLRQGNETEIQYINGYWIRRGREVGVPTPLNEELVRRVLIESRSRLMESRIVSSRGKDECRCK